MKEILFMLLNIVQVFRTKNWTVRGREKFNDYEVIDYFYGGNNYKYVGVNLPTSIRRGFFLPIKSAHWNESDMTDYVKMFAGPRHDFYGTDPPLDKMFYNLKKCTWVPEYTFRGLGFSVTWHKRTLVEPTPGKLVVKNILNQTVEFGAK
jgi:hypothetical protein